MGIFQWFKGEKEIRQLKDPTWWKSVFTGASTYSGQDVSPDSAMRQPAVFACVRVISEDVASLPIKIYSKISDMSREPIDNHPVSKLLQHKPNPEMTPFTLKETLTAHVLLYGNAYAEIERNLSGTPIALWILLPEYMSVKIEGGQVRYNYQTSGGSIVLEADNVLHLKGLGHDGIVGYSPIQYAKQTIGISQAMEESGGSFFANSSRPSGVLEHPAKLSEDASKRLRGSWQGMYSGSGNTGKTAILEEGMKWSSLSIPHSDAQWLEARAYALQDIARIYRVPPHMIGDLSRATFSNIEAQQIAYMQQTLMPWVRRWEQEINAKLIGDDTNSVYAEFLAEELLRGNTPERFSAYRTARESGWMSVNEIRKRENMNPIEGGDTFIQPLNFADVNLAQELQGGSEERNEDRTAWFDDSMKRVVSIVKNDALRKAKKLNEEEWKEWMDIGSSTIIKKVEEIMMPSCKDMDLNEKDVSMGLLTGLRSLLKNQKTLKDKEEACFAWAENADSKWSTFNEKQEC